MRNCLVTGNTATANEGGGVYGWAALTGCTVVANDSYGNGGGVSGGYTSVATLANCIVWDNQPNQLWLANAQYSDIQGGWAGPGNINADPLFANAPAGDYHLLSISPCIDTGQPGYQPQPGEVDCDRQKRVWDGDGVGGARVDMGVDEFGSATYGDLNCDGVVTFDDIDPFVLTLTDPALYEVLYSTCDVLLADCNYDGQVDFDDIDPFIALLNG